MEFSATKDGRGIRKALDFLVPTAIGERKWAYQEIEGGVKPQACIRLMRRAAAIYRDKSYQAVMAKVSAADPLIVEFVSRRHDFGKLSLERIKP